MNDTTESPEAPAKPKPAATKPAKPKVNPLYRIPLQADGPLHFGRLKLAASARVERFADLPAGVRPERLMDPAFWKHFAREIQPNDKIEAVCEDGSWEGLYRVMFVSQNEVRISPIYVKEHDTGDQAEVESDLYEIVWKGPGAKFAVVRKDNGAVIKDRLHPKSQALAFLREHLGRMKS